jgi:hypothetical protein
MMVTVSEALSIGTLALAICTFVFIIRRMFVKQDWSKDAIYTNHLRMQAQRTDLRIKHGLDPVQLQVLTENAENMRVAMERLSTPDEFVCPWGDTCVFKEDHQLIKDDKFGKIHDTRKNKDLLNDSPIHLVIGNRYGEKRRHWVYHVIAVCAEHERKALAGVKKRQSDREIARAATPGSDGYIFADDTLRFIF